MKNSFPSFAAFPDGKRFFRLFALIIAISTITGTAVAFFLWLLDLATALRWAHLWLILFLAPAGVLISFLYSVYGKNAAAGNNLVIDEIHEPGGGIPARMTPLVLFSTVITHLFGGSAGREGTAVQMGGSISYQFARWFHLNHADRSLLLKCGMAAGFGAVFGTPVTGAIFALEVLIAGKTDYNALLPCLAAGLLADFICGSFGIHHTQYAVAFDAGGGNRWNAYLAFDLLTFAKVLPAAVFFGVLSYFFSTLMHRVKRITGRYMRWTWLTPVVGAALVLGISYSLGTWDYLGLGVVNPAGGVSIVSSFSAGGATALSWLWKLLLTVITLGTGFKGGEVTPLFFIGATFGNAYASLCGAPVDLFAALGFIAVFAGATNTPIACTMMGIELFGWHYLIYYAIACFIAYFFSGSSGIYTSQKKSKSKFPLSLIRSRAVRP